MHIEDDTQLQAVELFTGITSQAEHFTDPYFISIKRINQVLMRLR